MRSVLRFALVAAPLTLVSAASADPSPEKAAAKTAPAAEPAAAPSKPAPKKQTTKKRLEAPAAERSEKATPKKRAKRRVERHSATQEKKRRTVLEEVTLFGRPQNPQAIFDITRVEPKFAVGTTQYSPRDRRFQKRRRR